MKKSLMLLLLLAGCSAPLAGTRIAAAANLGPVLPELVSSFQALHPGARLEISLASSGMLTAQILEGADYDIFLSADTNFPWEVYRQGHAQEPPFVYALGILVWLSPAPLQQATLQAVLSDPGFRQFVLANPATAPYGAAGLEVLSSLGSAGLTNQAVYAQNISQAVQYILTGVLPGFIPLSAVRTPAVSNFLASGAEYLIVDTSLYSPLRQAGVLLKGADNYARLFCRYLQSAEAREIFIRAGYRYD